MSYGNSGVDFDQSGGATRPTAAPAGRGCLPILIVVIVGMFLMNRGQVGNVPDELPSDGNPRSVEFPAPPDSSTSPFPSSPRDTRPNSDADIGTPPRQGGSWWQQLPNEEAGTEPRDGSLNRGSNARPRSAAANADDDWSIEEVNATRAPGDDPATVNQRPVTDSDWSIEEVDSPADAGDPRFSNSSGGTQPKATPKKSTQGDWELEEVPN